MNSDSLSYRTLKNISYSFLGVAIPILFSVFITREIFPRIGVAEFGVLILTNVITGILGLVDLGLTASVVKYISEFHTLNQPENLKKILNTANLVYWLIGFSGLAVFVVIGKFFLGAFNLGGAREGNIFLVFVLAGLTFFLTAVNSIYTSVPLALQRFDFVTKINLAQLSAYNIGSLILVLLGFQLKAIMAVNLLSVLGLTLAYRLVSKRLLPELRLKWDWHKSEFYKLYGFGLYSALASISASSLNQIDRLLIPIFLGPAQLSYYSLPGNVAQKTATVVGSLGGTFFPMANELAAKGEVERLGIIFRKIIRNLAVVAAATTVSIIVFGYKILYFWLGKDVADHGMPVLTVLALTYFILALFGILFNVLMGLSRQKMVAFWSLGMAVFNLVLLFALLKPFGIQGAAWAFLLGVLPVVFLFYWAEKRIFKTEGIFGFYNRLILKLLITAGVYVVIVKFLVFPFINSFAALIIVGPLVVLFYMILYRLLGFFEREDLEIFKAFARKIFVRFGLIKPTAQNEDIAN